MPRVQSKLSRALHAHRGKKLLRDIQNLGNTTMKGAMVRLRGARENDAMAFVECLGVSQENTMEGLLWRETLRRILRSHDAAGLVGGICRGNGCRQETTHTHAKSCTRRDKALLPTILCSTRHWLDPFARAKSSLLLKMHGPSQRELADKMAD